MTTVIFHSGDFDGIFCREIAKKFLGEKDVQYIGWDFGDPEIAFPSEGSVYVMDLPPKSVFGNKGPKDLADRTIWIDHHATSIAAHGDHIPGYRIDGVAACRLAWQWFRCVDGNAKREGSEIGIPIRPAGVLPMVQDFKNREVDEPLAVRLAGEYDVWDKRDPDAEVLHYGLRSCELGFLNWNDLFDGNGGFLLSDILDSGRMIQGYQQKLDADLVTYKSFRLKWEGLDFLCLNTGRFNSLTFAALDKPETGHDALLGFMWNGKLWTVSLYHAKHRTDLDLSQLAVKHGGGGHRGACGFTCKRLPFSLTN